MTRAAHRRGGTLRWGVLAVALALGGVVCLLLWGARSTPAAVAAPHVPQVAAAVTTPPGTDTAVAQPLPVPVRLRIPSLQLATRVIRLGLQQDGSVEVPANPDVAGWFRHGPPPGASGSSVILGHVDSVRGPAVFARLSELQRGAVVLVELDDGSTVRFTVHSVRTYANADFPAQQVYGRQGRPELNLVTCGGTYDAARGGYQANVVVNARIP